jgi:hypothetical protein
MLTVADLIVVLLFLMPGIPSGASVDELGSWRLIATIIVPIVVLLIVNTLSSSLKAMLVYWRPMGWLPGSAAFTKYAAEDPRISMQALTNNVGVLPTDPREQNAKWYQLYKQVDDEPQIAESHKNFLMYRDMAALSLPFIVIAPLCLYHAGASAAAQWIGAGIFGTQYLLTSVSARHSGIRFVTNVLATHSTRKVARTTVTE